MNNQIRLLTLTCTLLSCTSARAESVWNVLIENDLFTGTDRHYTSGVALNYVSGVNDGPRRLENMGVQFPGIERGDDIHVALSLGHEIYTPTDIRTPELLPDDRPYAAHAYLAAGFSTANHQEIETWRVAVGIVGPNAKGERIQNKVHKVVGSDDALGWQHQLEDEWVLSVAYEKKWLNRAWHAPEEWSVEMDFIPSFSAALGTPHTYLGLAGMLRFGQGLRDDQGPPKIRPSLPLSQYYDGTNAWYFFLGLEGRFIAHNLFLDGNNFVDSHAVDRHDFVAELQAGLVWNTRHFRVGYTYVIRTREFVQQDDKDMYGSLTLSLHF